ncbi:MAG: ABC transporter substrate-binding protein, partial [Clostridia bacterium]|nr:ABC transporter substrate-binding protein [Clostridia bacterium]
AEDVFSGKALSGCSAVKNGHVDKIPSFIESWDSPVPGSILGSVWLASILHPEAVTPEDSNGIIEEFYEKYYGFKPKLPYNA